MVSHLALRVSGVALAVLLASSAAAAVTPDLFVVENSGPNVGFNNPVGLAFAPDGRMFVAEKRGVVRVVRNGVKLANPLWSSEAEVLNNGDRGLLGVAVDPNYVRNHFVYFLYAVDPDSNGVDDDDDAFGRLVRYRTATPDSNVVDPASRAVLIGTDWAHGFPSATTSHGPGALRWGTDGSLLVTWGDGAQYNSADAGGRDSASFTPGRLDSLQDIGAFRSQYVGSLAGKLLRVNPATGHGYASNPFADGDLASNRSRVWSFGLRNPFRFAVRPGTGVADTSAANPGALFIGDVGWNVAEELNVAKQGAENFGWPCFEGDGFVSPYWDVHPAHYGCGSEEVAAQTAGIEHAGPSYLDAQLITNHVEPARSTPAGIIGNCVVAGTFYTGTTYPAPYRNRFFFGDFGQNWIKVAAFDSSQNLVEITAFATEADGPVDFAIDPVSGDVHYVSIYTGKVFRIRYTGPIQGNSTPLAVATADLSSGTAPLTVHFSSALSHDPDLDALQISWTFGDGSGSTELNPFHLFTIPGAYSVVLSTADGEGGVARDTVEVEVRGPTDFPSTGEIASFDGPDGSLTGSWAGKISTLAIQSNALVQTGTTSYAIWKGAIYGPNQEAWATFDPYVDGGEHSVLLKVQGLSWQDGHVQIHYDTDVAGVIILTYDRTAGWRRIGGPYNVHFGPGDQIGGRVYADGTVEAFRNGDLFARTDVGSWPFAGNGGRVGLLLANSAGARLENYGGGDIVERVNRAPVVTVDQPTERSFFAEGDTVRLVGMASDDFDSQTDLTYRWEVDIHHNNHIHPASIIADSVNASFIAENHDDGTGIWLRARFMALDRGGKSDTTSVDLYPEVDLDPSNVMVIPTQPGTDVPTTYRWAIYNNGHMPSPRVHWALLAGGMTLAEGDTLVPGKSQVDIERTVPPMLGVGTYDLQVVVDVRDTVVETNEINNVEAQPMTVVGGAGILGVDQAQRHLAMSGPFPNPAREKVEFQLELPSASAVTMAIYDVAGREVWATPERAYAPGQWTLAWQGRDKTGGRVSPGLYLARVKAGRESFVRRFTLIE